MFFNNIFRIVNNSHEKVKQQQRIDGLFLFSTSLNVSPKTSNNTHRNHTVLLGDMFLYNDEPGHCT